MAENVTTDAESVMCNFAERLAKDARLHHEVEAIVATELLSHKGLAELREVCTHWFKGGKQLHSDTAQAAHDPSRPEAEVAGLKFGGR